MPNPRHLLEVRITLPTEALSEEYVERVAAAIEAIRPDIKGQRVTVCYQGEEPRKKKK